MCVTILAVAAGLILAVLGYRLRPRPPKAITMTVERVAPTAPLVVKVVAEHPGRRADEVVAIPTRAPEPETVARARVLAHAGRG